MFVSKHPALKSVYQTAMIALRLIKENNFFVKTQGRKMFVLFAKILGLVVKLTDGGHVLIVSEEWSCYI